MKSDDILFIKWNIDYFRIDRLRLIWQIEWFNNELYFIKTCILWR